MPETNDVMHALRRALHEYEVQSVSAKPDFTHAKELADHAVVLSNRWAHNNHPGLFHDIGFVIGRAGADIASTLGGAAHAVGDAADHASGKDEE